MAETNAIIRKLAATTAWHLSRRRVWAYELLASAAPLQIPTLDDGHRATQRRSRRQDGVERKQAATRTTEARS